MGRRYGPEARAFRLCFGGLVIALWCAACYTDPFREQVARGSPRPGYRYYALHIRFSPPLLRFFAQRACDYNSAESWTVYFSRDPQSYTPVESWDLPNLHQLRRSSDLKLFLPQGVAILGGYRKTDFYGGFPIITALAPRNYVIGRREAELIEELQRDIRQRLAGSGVAATFSQDAMYRREHLEELPRVVDESGRLRQRRRPGKSSDKWTNRPFAPLQRARSGPHFLSYMLMVGVTPAGAQSRLELWNLPVFLPDSDAPFQYLGELEIGLAPGAESRLRFDSLGRALLSFRVNDHFAYWEAYLDAWLGGRKGRERLQAQAQPDPTPVRGQSEATLKPGSPSSQKLQGDFVPNLLQLLDEDNTVRRHYPYLRLEYGANQSCRF